MEDRTGTIQTPAPERRLGRVLLDAVAESVLNVILFSFRFLGWCLGWTFATVFFLAVMGGAGYYVFTQAIAGEESVVVPNIVKLPITEASYRLAEQGLEIGKQTEVYSEEVKPYHVIAQRPAAGRGPGGAHYGPQRGQRPFVPGRIRGPHHPARR